MVADRKEEIVSKIMKLMELGNEEKNSNPHEREAATRMAAKMMAEYSIDFADLRSGKPKEDVFITITVDGTSEHKVDFESMLALLIAKAFDCNMINTYRNGPWQIAFVGTKNDLEIAVFFFKYLRRTLFAMAKLRYPKDVHSARRNYCYGLVVTIGERLEELYQKREEFIPSDCKALVVVKKDGLQKYYDQQFPGRVSSRRTRLKGDLGAYHNGKSDGKNVNLSRPISHTSEKRAAIG